MNLSRRLLVLGSTVLLAGSLAACGSDTPTAETTPTPTTSAPAAPSPSGGATGSAGASEVCAATDQVRAAIVDVRDVNILQEGTDAFKAQFATLDTAVDNAVAAARTDFATEADALRQAKETLSTAVSGLAASPSVSAVASVGTALTGVTSAFNTLASAMDDAC